MFYLKFRRFAEPVSQSRPGFLCVYSCGIPDALFSLHEQKVIQEEVEVALNTRQKLAAPLIEKEVLSCDSRRFRFGLPTKKHKLGLPIGKHFFVSGRWNGEFVMRPYTPVTGDEVTGFVDLVIKVRDIIGGGGGLGRGGEWGVYSGHAWP